MGQVVQVNGDYTIKAKQGSNIIFDVGTGPEAGDVKITGNLTVVGETLIVQTTDLAVEDNIITLNRGEEGSGVTKILSGIEIDRGLLANTSFIYDESTQSWQIAEGSTELGFNNFSNSALRLKTLLTSMDEDEGDLTLFAEAGNTGVLKVGGAALYNERVTNDNDIPNKRYVDLAIQTNPTFQIRSPGALVGVPESQVKGDTRVVAFDYSAIYDEALFPIGPFTEVGDLPSESFVALLVDNQLVGSVFVNRFNVAGLTFWREEPSQQGLYNDPPVSQAPASIIQTTGTDGNLKLETNGPGKVEITNAIQFNDNQGYNEDDGPTAFPLQSVIYGGKIGAGNTGIYVSAQNFNSTNIQRSELISKKKALLFSMLF
jgi:hypothetical protein